MDCSWHQVSSLEGVSEVLVLKHQLKISGHFQNCFPVSGIRSEIHFFGFINGVDNVNWPPYRDSKS